MPASGNLKGHGRPSVFLAGQVGQKYKDLDSGLEWVCTGERGFIKVDGDDQSEMYNWELVESGGSTGGGVFTVNFTQNEDKSVTSDKTLDEIVQAYNNGMVVRAVFQGIFLYPEYINPEMGAMFYGFMIEEGAGAVYLVIVQSNGEIFFKQQFVALTSTPTT